MTECISQAEFAFLKKCDLRISFDAGQMTSDAGLPIVRQLDDHLGLTRRFAEALTDWRNPAATVHSMHDLVRCRVFGIIQGYEDANDFSLLRTDPLFKACCDRLAQDAHLPSQPTFSRFENCSTRGGTAAARATLLEHYIRRWKVRFQRPKQITLELDTTHDPTHGQQELALFNGHYCGYCYQELLIHSEEGDLLFAELLPGTGNVRFLAVQALDEVVTKLRQQWPGIKIKVRADNGFAGPELYDFCEDRGLEYLVNAGTYQVYQKQASHLVERAEVLFQAAGGQASALVYSDFVHQAKEWRAPRRIVAKAQRTPTGPDLRFLITNSQKQPYEVYDDYCRRGQEENWIKDLKRGLKSDRLSCSDFAANELRLLLFALAYQLAHELRRRAPTPLRSAELDTLRKHLLRIPALIKQTARKLWVRITSDHPSRTSYLQLAGAVGAAVG